MQKTIEIIRDYATNTKSLLDIAIMLNGAWGSGKTYFVKDILIPVLGERKCVYVSINGVKSVDEITNRLILSALGSDTVPKKDTFWSSLGSFLKNINWGAKGNITRDLTVAFSGYIRDVTITKRLKNHLLIIDDLERVSNELSIEEVLGYFNSYFIEKHGQKVLFVCNEEEIKNQDDYKKIKEKSISWTIKYEPHFENFINSIIDKESLKYHNQFIRAELDNFRAIIELYKAAKIDNLRTVIKVIEIFNRIMADNNESMDNPLALRLYRMITMLVNETSSDKTNPGNVKFIEAVRENKDLPLSIIKLKDDYEKSMNEMVIKYFDGMNYKWLYLPYVHDYISTHHYDKDRISAEFEELIRPETPASKALNKFLSRDYLETEDDVRQALMELEDHVENDRYELRDLLDIHANLQDNHLSEVYKTNVDVLEGLVLNKVEQMINECNNSIELNERFHFLESDYKFHRKFIESLKPTYDARKEQLMELYVREGLKQFLESPVPGSPFLEELINSGIFFRAIIEFDFVDYVCKMNAPRLMRFHTALEVELQRHDNVITLKPEEKESVRTIIDGLKENASNDQHHKDKQDRLIATLELFLKGGRGHST